MRELTGLEKLQMMVSGIDPRVAEMNKKSNPSVNGTELGAAAMGVGMKNDDSSMFDLDNLKRHIGIEPKTQAQIEKEKRDDQILGGSFSNLKNTFESEEDRKIRLRKERGY